MGKNHGASLLALLLAIGGIVAWIFLPVLSAESTVAGITIKGELTGMATIFGGKLKVSTSGGSLDVEVLKFSTVLCVAFACACLGGLIVLAKTSGAAKNKIISAFLALILLAGAAVVIFLTKDYVVVKDSSYNMDEFKLGYGAYIAMGCLGLSGIVQLADLK